jgi:hypothetical protein
MPNIVEHMVHLNSYIYTFQHKYRSFACTPNPTVHCDKITVNDKLFCQNAVTEIAKEEHISVTAVTPVWGDACRRASSVGS